MGNIVGGPAVPIILDAQDLSNHQTGSIHQATSTHTEQVCRVCVHSQMMNLTFKILEVPGSLEVRWGGGVVTSPWRLKEGKRYEMWKS